MGIIPSYKQSFLIQLTAGQMRVQHVSIKPVNKTSDTFMIVVFLYPSVSVKFLL